MRPADGSTTLRRPLHCVARWWLCWCGECAAHGSGVTDLAPLGLRWCRRRPLPTLPPPARGPVQPSTALQLQTGRESRRLCPPRLPLCCHLARLRPPAGPLLLHAPPAGLSCPPLPSPSAASLPWPRPQLPLHPSPTSAASTPPHTAEAGLSTQRMGRTDPAAQPSTQTDRRGERRRRRGQGEEERRTTTLRLHLLHLLHPLHPLHSPPPASPAAVVDVVGCG